MTIARTGTRGRSTAGASRSRSDCGTRDTRRASPASGTSPPTSGHRPTPGRHAGASTASSGPCRAAEVTIARRRSRAGRERRARGPGTRIFLHRRHHGGGGGVRPGSGGPRAGAPVLPVRGLHRAALAAPRPGRGHCRYRGVFDAGWDDLREARFRRLVAEDLVPAGTSLSGRDPSQPAWRDAPHPAWQLGRMRAYAAQIDRMDRGIGRIVEALAETGALADTLFLFLSDNGASAEDLPLGDPDAFRRRHSIVPPATWAGAPLRIGNTPDVEPGPEDTYASYGRAWANLSNTPFRYYKRWVHEGGIATPFIAHWPAGGIAPGVIDAPFQLVDVVPTVLEAAGVTPEPFTARGIGSRSRGRACCRPSGAAAWSRDARLGARRQRGRPARPVEARAGAWARVGALRRRPRPRGAPRPGGEPLGCRGRAGRGVVGVGEPGGRHSVGAGRGALSAGRQGGSPRVIGTRRMWSSPRGPGRRA